MTGLRDFEFLVLGLFSASLAVVRTALRNVLVESFDPTQFAIIEGALDLDAVYVGRPPAGGAHPKRVVLFEPSNAPGKSAMIPNMEDGWLTLVNVLAQRVSGEHMLLRSSLDDAYPITDLEVWCEGTSVRYVGAIKEDPSWEFNQRGEPRSFEEPAQYTKHRIRERFNREVAVATLARAGWRVGSQDFWQSRQRALYARERQGGGPSMA